MCESHRYTALAAMERRRAATFGGLGAEVLQAGLHPRHDGGQLGYRALAAASTTSRGDVDRGTGPEASNFGFSSLSPTAGAPRRRRSISYGSARGGKHSGPLGSCWCGPRQPSCRHSPSRGRGRCACARRGCCRQHWSDQRACIRWGGSCTACMACIWARATRHHRRVWPCGRDTPPPPVLCRLRGWLPPAEPAGAGSVAASQATQGSPSARKRPRSRSPSPVRVTRRARQAEHECARRPEEPSAPPPPKRLRGGGGAQPKRLR